MHEHEAGAMCPNLSADEALILVKPANRLGMSPCEMHGLLGSGAAAPQAQRDDNLTADGSDGCPSC